MFFNEIFNKFINTNNSNNNNTFINNDYKNQINALSGIIYSEYSSFNYKSYFWFIETYNSVLQINGLEKYDYKYDLNSMFKLISNIDSIIIGEEIKLYIINNMILISQSMYYNPIFSNRFVNNNYENTYKQILSVLNNSSNSQDACYDKSNSSSNFINTTNINALPTISDNNIDNININLKLNNDNINLDKNCINNNCHNGSNSKNIINLINNNYIVNQNNYSISDNNNDNNNNNNLSINNKNSILNSDAIIKNMNKKRRKMMKEKHINELQDNANLIQNNTSNNIFNQKIKDITLNEEFNSMNNIIKHSNSIINLKNNNINNNDKNINTQINKKFINENLCNIVKIPNKLEIREEDKKDQVEYEVINLNKKKKLLKSNRQKNLKSIKSSPIINNNTCINTNNKEILFNKINQKKVISDLYSNDINPKFYLSEKEYTIMAKYVDVNKNKQINGLSLSKFRKEFLEKTKLMQAELNEFKKIYNYELNKCLESNPKHVYMKLHFPLAYNEENFYKYIYKIEIRRKDINLYTCNINKDSNNINDKSACNQFNYNADKILDEGLVPNITKMRKIWSPDEDKINDKQIIDLLYNVEKRYPIESYKWTQEVILELLMRYNYNADYFLAFLEDLDFKQVINEKSGLSTNNIPTDENSRRKLSLRKSTIRQQYPLIKK